MIHQDIWLRLWSALLPRGALPIWVGTLQFIASIFCSYLQIMSILFIKHVWSRAGTGEVSLIHTLQIPDLDGLPTRGGREAHTQGHTCRATTLGDTPAEQLHSEIHLQSNHSRRYTCRATTLKDTHVAHPHSETRTCRAACIQRYTCRASTLGDTPAEQPHSEIHL
jgi:hypothetical protein